MREVFPIIAGDAQFDSGEGILFGNLKPLTNGELVDAKPDLYDGAPPEAVDKQIRDELETYIKPSGQSHPLLPDFFHEAKGPMGTGAVAKRQAWYDGALGARGMHKLQSFQTNSKPPKYDNNAYTITSTYVGGTLNIYTTHPTLSTSDPVKNDASAPTKYHVNLLQSISMIGNPDSFRQGATCLRNARDWGKGTKR